MLRLLIVALAALWFAAASPSVAADRPLVVLVSIDGFRPDYLDRGITPVLSRLAAEGARGSMRPSFPSKTFPNHYTLVTGLRPDRHGIVDNTMEDPAIPGVTFRMSNAEAVRDRRWWDQGEPIWVTAERAGIPTATMFWPGSEADIRGVWPTHSRAFDQAVPSDARVDQLLAWLDAPARPGFATLYFDIVDTAGHNHGPNSPEVNAAVATADAAMGRLLAGLKTRGIAANIVVVADHGMAEMDDARQVYMDDLLPGDAYRYLGAGAFMTIYPAEGREREVRRALLKRHDNLRCWKTSRMPARFQYGKNPRVAPYFCLPTTGWRVTTRAYKPSRPERGAHGFDNFSPEMRAIFLANGPGIRPGVTVRDFDNVDVYPLLARLTGVKPAPNDGDLRELRAALTR